MEQSEPSRGPGDTFGTARMVYRKSIAQKERREKCSGREHRPLGAGRPYSVTHGKNFFFSFYLIRSNARKIADEKSGWQRSAWLSVFHCVHGLLNFGYQGEKQ